MNSVGTKGSGNLKEPDSFPKMLQFLLKNLLFISTNFLPLSCLFY
uniref:Macaca fascicularis brain cDNA clone: QflA-18851, similar to human hippocampus abundant transcript 1 (HIAT1), mRNA, RefSeq: NM_033055.2 n=1 Tax=Macaca fascicularis TaxID=9541 RepID=I7G5X1_MACFA|nr:unnamed protein product [Macaca fascicularis]